MDEYFWMIAAAMVMLTGLNIYLTLWNLALGGV